MRRVLIAALISLLAGTVGAASEKRPLAVDPVYVKLAITDGDVYLSLNPLDAPKTVANFLQYVKDGHYDGTVFHRVIPGFVAQAGGYTADFKEKKTREPIENESRNGLSNLRGTIAMARTGDPHSATAQWYINLDDNTRLDATEHRWGYTVFGKVVYGMEVIDDIAEIPTGPAGPFGSDMPFRPVVIKTATVVEELPTPEDDALISSTAKQP